MAAALALVLGACAPHASVRGSASDGVVFVRIVDGSSELMRARIADGAVLPLTATPEREESWPSWSQATGRLLVQVTDVPGGDASRSRPARLVLLDPETGAETTIAGGDRRDARWPVWSPDGRRLAYAFRGGRPTAGIALYDAERGTTTPLATSGPRDFFFRPHFAPDGERLVAQRRGADGRGSALWLLAPGRPPAPLGGGGDWFDMKADFTRDGSQIVFSRRPAAGGPRDVWIQPAAGGPGRPIASEPEADDHSARPSPTADEIAFVSDRLGSPDVFLADLRGGAPRPLTRTPERDEFAPRWSPDGERLLVTATPSEVGALRMGDRAGLERSRVLVLDRDGRVLLDVAGFMPDWMPPWP